MQTEPQASLDCEAPLHVHNNSYTGDDPGLILSYPNDAGSQKPAKRPTRKKTPTRQWAAWTREEEESFFTALRQVGKNFEKITSRVQSKNKDQVRHYYYRLVRRMNKLLGPGFCLDARNSKDTIAAMLRWWSLLEKYSCKASKLHLKPRRFKIFIEALELQLLKDQKKSIKKRPSQENCSPAAPSNISSQTRASGNDNRAAKPVLVDSQNVQKLGPGKASSLKRNVNIGVNRNNSKGDSSNGKTTRQRRKPAGPVSSAAYKRWEKAAIAGVSLVADAAEHLERTGTDKEVECDQGQKGFDPAANMLSPSPLFSQNTCVESNTQSSSKLKLQLFPIDEATRRALEMDKHNPHLELTLSTRKKISSVLDHLNRKWGDSSIASGELMLFPYSVQRENLVPYQRWTQDSIVTASDVYARIGSPAVFRLRYGWISANELGFATHRAHSTTCSLSSEHIVNVSIRKEQTDSIPVCAALTDQQYEDLVKSHNDKLPSTAENTSCLQPSTDVADVPDEIRTDGLGLKNSSIESYNPAANMAWHSREADDGTFVKQVEDSDGLRLCNGTGISAGEWADSLTNISVGDLLSEVSRVMDASCIDPPVGGSSQCLQPSPFTCDSFDAAIAAHISRHQDKTGFQSDPASYSTSIWDAEETCDAFSFQKNSVIRPEFPDASRIAHPGACEQIPRINSRDHGGLIEEMPEADGPTGDFACEYLTDECHSDPHMLDSAAKDFNGLSDIYWPDSLGPLDLEIPSTRYQSNDMILSDSLSGLNRLIASSLDAFQNCTFFGEEKKETASSVEACESASFSDFKIGSEV